MDNCAICGCKDQDLNSDHHRKVYYFKNQDKFDKALFVPRCFIFKDLLQSGFNKICSNRKKCLERLRELSKNGN